MDECSLSARGRTFDVERFLAESSLVPTKVWRRGRPIHAKSKQSFYEDSGFDLLIAKAPKIDVENLIDATLRFVRENLDKLQLLREAPSVERMNFTISIEREIQRMSCSIDPVSVFDNPDYSVEFSMAPELMQLLATIQSSIVFRVWPLGFDEAWQDYFKPLFPVPE